MRSRTLTAVAGVLASLAVSAVLYVYLDTLFVFLVVPFVPVLFRGLRGDGDVDDRPQVRECPECGFRTRDEEYEFCPRDGLRLRE